MKNISILSFLLLVILQSCNINTNTFISQKLIDSLVNAGEYTKAQQITKLKIAVDTSLTPLQIKDLDFQAEVLDRIKDDFTRTDSSIYAYIKEVYPQVTQQELDNWEKSGALECKIIDGQKKYFYNAHRNLFRISKDAQNKQNKIKGRQSDSLDRFLAKFIPQLENHKGRNYSTNKFEKLIDRKSVV